MKENLYTEEEIKRILKAFLEEKSRAQGFQERLEKEEISHASSARVEVFSPEMLQEMRALSTLWSEVEKEIKEGVVALQQVTQEGALLLEQMRSELRNHSAERRERREIEAELVELKKNYQEVTALSEMRQTTLLQVQEQLHREEERHLSEKKRMEVERQHLVERLAEALSQLQHHKALIKELEAHKDG